MQMNNKLSCSRLAFPRGIEKKNAGTAIAALTLFFFTLPGPTRAGDAPQWMRALVNAPLPEHDEKTNAVLLFAEDTFTVQGNGKMKRIERRVYKILRPDGRSVGTVHADFDSETKINFIHGWCIPAQGKDYEVKDKEAIETAVFGVQDGELMSDLKTKVLTIPASEPGNIVGYEIEQEVHPYVIQDIWSFQREDVPVREARYTLQLPSGWEYKAVWLNHAEVAPASVSGQWQWVVTNVKAIKPETAMPPWGGVAGQMVVSLIPSGGSANKGFESWSDMARWQDGLNRGRRTATPEIKQRVADLTKASATPLDKMRALAQSVQKDVRYVAIQLGIGGWQPHPAADVFTHKYGDCKDKATLLSSMLQEIGVPSFYVSINTTRSAVTPQTPAIRWFNHVILAVRLPDNVIDPSLRAVLDHPKLGRLLFFDPTDEWTPFGSLRGELQANYGLLVTDDGGELIKLPLLPAGLSGVVRTAKLTLSPSGTLSGDFFEQRNGDYGTQQRAYLKSVPKDADRIKFLESLISHSLTTFQITKASLENLNQTDQPFGYRYSLTAQNYAKTAGNLLLVRPRVVGSNSSDLLETKEPRKYPVEFGGPWKNSDTIEIAIPAGYEVDDLPPPVNADYSFASYHSKTEASGNTLKYTRTFEVKELSVPVTKIEDLKKLYRIIAGDERNTAVLKPAGH
jgi:transglutaminase-like putative cysteine protease